MKWYSALLHLKSKQHQHLFWQNSNAFICWLVQVWWVSPISKMKNKLCFYSITKTYICCSILIWTLVNWWKGLNHFLEVLETPPITCFRLNIFHYSRLYKILSVYVLSILFSVGLHCIEHLWNYPASLTRKHHTQWIGISHTDVLSESKNRNQHKLKNQNSRYFFPIGKI